MKGILHAMKRRRWDRNALARPAINMIFSQIHIYLGRVHYIFSISQIFKGGKDEGKVRGIIMSLNSNTILRTEGFESDSENDFPD